MKRLIAIALGVALAGLGTIALASSGFGRTAIAAAGTLVINAPGLVKALPASAQAITVVASANRSISSVAFERLATTPAKRTL